ncbi:MAG: SIS domain-containing protein [Clostridia bacterium]|nr:SIS domain-containing protein [Clostridia bacterium]MBR3593247.1 SIS domain-containing protein [Clostridia bacterium]
MNVLDSFCEISREEFNTFVDNIDKESLSAAAELILESKKKGGRLHITGIGKPSHVANYIASLISSTGTPTYYLHGTEAVHGSCGQLAEGDVVICISNSGETGELKATAAAIRNNGCRLIAVTGKCDSWLGRFCDVCLFAGVEREGGVLNRAPRASILAETFVLQCLSVLLQEQSDLTPQEYVKRHPGGALGALRENEK